MRNVAAGEDGTSLYQNVAGRPASKQAALEVTVKAKCCCDKTPCTVRDMFHRATGYSSHKLLKTANTAGCQRPSDEMGIEISCFSRENQEWLLDISNSSLRMLC